MVDFNSNSFTYIFLLMRLFQEFFLVVKQASASTLSEQATAIEGLGSEKQLNYFYHTRFILIFLVCLTRIPRVPYQERVDKPEFSMYVLRFVFRFAINIKSVFNLLQNRKFLYYLFVVFS